MRLGVIADDFTGATDIASFLVGNGLWTIQLNGVPSTDISMNTDAVVISLKSRSCDPLKAIRQSVEALQWLKEHHCQQYFFKYCSTFDSTAKGNIGPVTDALLDVLDEELTVICPALPINGRTIYNGYLFVNHIPLSESGMRHHPVTPMTDSNLMRVMEAQSKGRCANISTFIIDQGVAAVKAELEKFKEQKFRYVVLDALNDHHIAIIGQAVATMKLVTGGSGLADGIARSWRADQNNIQPAEHAGQPKQGPTVIISGSCSQMTNAQVETYRQEAPTLAMDIQRTINDAGYLQEVIEWVLSHSDQKWAPLVYATMPHEQLKATQQAFGAEIASTAIEKLFGLLAKLLAGKGYTRFIVAGGETAGSVAQSLNINGFIIGPQIAPGVPWVRGIGQDLSLALKSGNFGQERFFFDAQEIAG